MAVAERLKSKMLEQEQAIDLIAGPDAYRDLPRWVCLERCLFQADGVWLLSSGVGVNELGMMLLACM